MLKVTELPKCDVGGARDDGAGVIEREIRWAEELTAADGAGV